MSFFRGTFPHTIDAKGRLSVPTRFRELLKAKEDNRLVITRGTHPDCLSVYPMDQWQKVEADVNNASSSLAKEKFMRFFISPAMECTMDKMGRVLVPAQLRDEAGLNKDVMVVGALSKFELWDKTRWDDYNREARSEALELLEKENISF